MTTRQPKPTLSRSAQTALAAYQQHLHDEVDLRPATIRNYLSDLRHFMAWCEDSWPEDQDAGQAFALERVATPTLTRYREHLQHEIQLKPATINRHLVSLKRYFSWAADQGVIPRSPASVVKLVPQTSQPAYHLADHEEAALVAAADGPLKGILAYTKEPLVSIDLNHNPASSTFALDQTKVIEGDLVRVMSWYDNEWGFSNRMADTVAAFGRAV